MRRRGTPLPRLRSLAFQFRHWPGAAARRHGCRRRSSSLVSVADEGARSVPPRNPPAGPFANEWYEKHVARIVDGADDRLGGGGELMAECVIAVAFDDSDINGDELARTIDDATKNKGSAVRLYTEGFQPSGWPKAEVTITIRQS